MAPVYQDVNANFQKYQMLRAQRKIFILLPLILKTTPPYIKEKQLHPLANYSKWLFGYNKDSVSSGYFALTVLFCCFHLDYFEI